MKIIKPTLVINKEKVLKNILRMKEKIENTAIPVRFRPHFKTHQSAEVGEWFRELGTSVITVSSVDMAFYFFQHGWQDITIAILVNPLEIEAINRLAEKEQVTLNLLVDSREMVSFLDKRLKSPVKLWIKIETGYHRTGVEWDSKDEVLQIAKKIKVSPKLNFSGLLTHSGHSYRAGSKDLIRQVYNDTVTKLTALKGYLENNGIAGTEISLGDTPTCSILDQFDGIDEIRPGNFVYYDVMQLFLGSCREEDIASAVACPVIAKYPHREEIVIYGGAVHLSKDFVTDKKNRKVFGLVAFPEKDFQNWEPSINDTYVSTLSQEHGVIKIHHRALKQVKVGDILMVLPVHSCLAVHCLRQFETNK